jgi:5-methylcytosine-specific restriction endonuclease McrA
MAARFELPELSGYRFPWYGRMPDDLWRILRQFVYERDGEKCQYCDDQTELFDCHCHHVLPLSEHGTNHPSNLKTSCKPCHKERHPFMKSAKELYL